MQGIHLLHAMAIVMTLIAGAGRAQTTASLVEQVADGVWAVRDDTGGSWGGWSMGVTHMRSHPYQAKKILDLSDVPVDAWEQTREVRLSAYIMVRDYSVVESPPGNGLDEEFEVVVNGRTHTYSTGCGAAAWRDGVANVPDWYDFALPKDQFVRGVNEIVFRKARSDKNDDYLYLGIDNITPRGNSAVTFDGKSWTQDKLTAPGGNGEYMVRLYLIAKDTQLRVTWQPGAQQPLDDPGGLVRYAGSRDGKVAVGALALEPGRTARMEWRPGALDRLHPAEARVRASGAVSLAWLDEDGRPMAAQHVSALTLPANRTKHTSGVVVTSGPGGVQLHEIVVEARTNHHPQRQPIDIAPVIAPPPPPASPQSPLCKIEPGSAILRNGSIEARFETSGQRLRLTSLRHVPGDAEMARRAEDLWLFLVEVEGQRYAGSRDFRLTAIEPVEAGFVAEMGLDKPALAARLRATIDDEGLRISMELANAAAEPVDFKLAFPHLQGLALSDDSADDYYFYPWGGGVIADRPALLRGGYGDHQVLYQLMDLFAPAKGVGLYLRIDDPDGWHKNLALQKTLSGRSVEKPTQLVANVRAEFQWESSLEDVEGVGMSAEYLRRTRGPGDRFAPAAAVLAAHPGDWHVAMERYAAWAHEVWQWRPWPSRLKSCHNMIAAGWGTGYLFRDGAYRTDIIHPRTDCIELMSWWDWSETGPFSTPMDQLDTGKSAAEIERWKGYFVKDPVTGRKMWNNAPDDYRGYNERFGGLPAFREAIENYRKLGAGLVTLYTDPFRLHDDCETGRAFGREWGVVGVDGEKTRSYLVWNPCHDLPAVRKWVAETMGRVMRETGADGIRLDEYGHRGWACYDESHDHTYAEWGITQWQKATAEATRLVREAMDEVSSDLVLTTEHPGYDYLMQYKEGCITYDLTVLGLPTLRPLQVNTQRFYFPACKAYELDHRRVDPEDRRKFWNAVGSFGRYYPLPYHTALRENENVYQSGDAYPLLVTPGNAQYVYVNRFHGAGKTIWHMFNATGHTFEGQALAIEIPDGHHLFDLLECRQVEPTVRADGLAGVSIYLERTEVASIIQLPRRLHLTRQGDALHVRAELPAGNCRLVVASVSGEHLLSEPAAADAVLDLSQISGDQRGACVKLLCDGQLVDVAELPQ